MHHTMHHTMLQGNRASVNLGEQLTVTRYLFQLLSYFGFHPHGVLHVTPHITYSICAFT